MSEDVKLDQSAKILVQQILNKVSDEISNPNATVNNVFIFIWQNDNQVKKIEKYVEHRDGIVPIGKPIIRSRITGKTYTKEEIAELFQKNDGSQKRLCKEIGIDQGNMSRFIRTWRIEYKRPSNANGT